MIPLAGCDGALPVLVHRLALLDERRHPLGAIFQREGADLFCEVPIRFSHAALGGEVAVPTLGGEALIRIPAETQTGKLFRLRGKGVKPVRGGEHGDLLCRVVVETPVNLTERQKELLREFEESASGNATRHNPKAQGWMDKVRDFFGG